MEKRTPHYRLNELQTYIRERGTAAFTATALFNIAALELTIGQALQVLASLAREMFYKSMTTHNDSSVWQDVYHAPLLNGKMAYIKLTQKDGVVVIQFKEK
jgi:motility quorum-sensing regulator/GCU-specific mRNA interferase toxin